MGKLSETTLALSKFEVFKQRTQKPPYPKTLGRSLQKMREMQKLLGYPDRSYRSIHVAGTNGKGSVCFKLANVLEAMGYKVGLFISPHVHFLQERISANQKRISEERAGELSDYIYKLAQRNDYSLMFFEEFTLLALVYFAEEKVDYVVWEAGIGGMWDPTNIIEPIISVITSIGWDHMDLLGDTLEKIALQKAGIIKRKTPVVVGPSANLPCIKVRAQRKEASYYPIEKTFPDYEQENQEVVRKTLSVLFPNTPPSSYEEKLKKMPPYRFERQFHQGRLFLMDVAHNLSGFEKLKEALLYHYPGKKWSFILAFSKTSNLALIFELLESLGKIYVTSSSHFKLLSLEQIQKSLPQKVNVTFVESLEKALILAFKDPEDIVISGSFYLFENAVQTLSSFHPE